MTVSYPADYSSAYQSVVFGVSGVTPDDNGCVAVDILTGNNVEAIGVKNIYERYAFDVDVSAYARTVLSVEPITKSGLMMAPTRSVAMSVRVGMDQSDKIMVTAGSEVLPSNTLLSDSSRRFISLTESDEIAFITNQMEVWPSVTVIDNDGAMYSWREELFMPDKGVLVYGVNMPKIVAEAQNNGINPQNIRSITIAMRIGAEEQVQVKYEVKNSDKGVRLAWVNRFGAIDYFTFPTTLSTRVVSSRESRYVGSSYQTLSLAAWRELSLSSGILPRQMVEWLAGISTSSSVWLVEGEHFEPCEVLSDSVEVCAGTAPIAVKLVVRTQKDIPTQ